VLAWRGLPGHVIPINQAMDGPFVQEAAGAASGAEKRHWSMEVNSSLHRTHRNVPLGVIAPLASRAITGL
jgi:hypothetical protein